MGNRAAFFKVLGRTIQPGRYGKIAEVISELYIGIMFLIIGIVMTVYRQNIGVFFCKMGKQAFEKNSKVSFFSKKEINSMYDESRAPRIFGILGVVNIFQGLFFILVGLI